MKPEKDKSFGRAFLEKWVWNLASIKVWAMLWTLLAFGWGGVTGVVACLAVLLSGRHLEAGRALMMLRAPGLFTANQLIALWIPLLGLRAVGNGAGGKIVDAVKKVTGG